MEIRPWGTYEVLIDDLDYKVKRIVVNAGQRLSYQSHEKRDEHWTIVKGSGIVILDGSERQVNPGDEVYITRQVKHRICAEEQLTFIEVQTGEYFGEDDIVRYEDDYGRSK